MKRFFTRRRLTLEERTLADGTVVIVLPPKCSAEEAERFKELWRSKHATEATR